MNADHWSTDGVRITEKSVLNRIRLIIEHESAVIVEHRFYRGSRSPHRFVCDDYDALEAYLREHTARGDSFYVWHFERCCRDDNVSETGKIPDPAGRVPTGGAY